MITKVKEVVPPIGQFLYEMEVGDWFKVRPSPKEHASGLGPTTLCVKVAPRRKDNLDQDTEVFIPTARRVVKMPNMRPVIPSLAVEIREVDQRPKNPSRSVREASDEQGGLVRRDETRL